MRLTTILLMICLSTGAMAQTFQIKGRVKDSNDTTGIIGASISVTTPKDTTKRFGAFTDINGNFAVLNLQNGLYNVKITSIGYTTQQKVVTITDQDFVFDDIMLVSDAKLLKEVVVQSKAIRVEQKGDTTQYNAESFKVNQDANAEDLLKKMPGVSVVDGKVQAQGEDIKRVTVDGREFFGDDATAALKNLPAEIIDKVQVFDRLSDQAQFSGFNDGNTEKTVNIVT
ncbi:carboxypeptidase-like regulatory domain-containing protein [Nostoc sp. CHAB 5824]|nr:carboxypeptidase-like regulatory domain-containing protein [Nostoc sp. CHAB 5824]